MIIIFIHEKEQLWIFHPKMGMAIEKKNGGGARHIKTNVNVGWMLIFIHEENNFWCFNSSNNMVMD